MGWNPSYSAKPKGHISSHDLLFITVVDRRWQREVERPHSRSSTRLELAIQSSSMTKHNHEKGFVINPSGRCELASPPKISIEVDVPTFQYGGVLC